jgi:Bacteriocin-protection, YdeI or OmpD-Associated
VGDRATIGAVDRSRTFSAVVSADGSRVVIPVPFDPDDVWGPKPVHHVAGTVDGMDVRAVVERIDDGWAVRMGPAWWRDRCVSAGDTVTVVLAPEGPQREDLAPDVAAAVADDAAAAAFFDSLAQFYRRAYLRWIDATKRRPDLRTSASPRSSACAGTGSRNGRPRRAAGERDAPRSFCRNATCTRPVLPHRAYCDARGVTFLIPAVL